MSCVRCEANPLSPASYLPTFDTLSEGRSLGRIYDRTGSISEVADRAAREALTFYGEWGQSSPTPVIFFRYEKGEQGWSINGERMRDLFDTSQPGGDRRERFVKAEDGMLPNGQAVVFSEDLGEGWDKSYIYVYTDFGDHIEGTAFEHRGSHESLKRTKARLAQKATSPGENVDNQGFSEPLFFREHVSPVQILSAVIGGYDASDKSSHGEYIQRLDQAVTNYTLLKTQFERNVTELALRAEEQFVKSEIGTKLFSDVAHALVQSLEQDTGWKHSQRTEIESTTVGRISNNSALQSEPFQQTYPHALTANTTVDRERKQSEVVGSEIYRSTTIPHRKNTYAPSYVIKTQESEQLGSEKDQIRKKTRPSESIITYMSTEPVRLATQFAKDTKEGIVALSSFIAKTKYKRTERSNVVKHKTNSHRVLGRFHVTQDVLTSDIRVQQEFSNKQKQRKKSEHPVKNRARTELVVAKQKVVEMVLYAVSRVNLGAGLWILQLFHTDKTIIDRTKSLKPEQSLRKKEKERKKKKRVLPEALGRLLMVVMNINKENKKIVIKKESMIAREKIKSVLRKAKERRKAQHVKNFVGVLHKLLHRMKERTVFSIAHKEVNMPSPISTQKEYKIRMEEFRKVQKQLVIQFVYTLVIWMLIDFGTTKKDSDLLIHAKDFHSLKDRSKKQKYKEAKNNEKSQWVLFGIIWFLAMIREQRKPVAPKKKQKKKAKINTTNIQTFPVQGIIFAFST